MSSWPPKCTVHCWLLSPCGSRDNLRCQIRATNFVVRKRHTDRLPCVLLTIDESRILNLIFEKVSIGHWQRLAILEPGCVCVRDTFDAKNDAHVELSLKLHRFDLGSSYGGKAIVSQVDQCWKTLHYVQCTFISMVAVALPTSFSA